MIVGPPDSVSLLVRQCQFDYLGPDADIVAVCGKGATHTMRGKLAAVAGPLENIPERLMANWDLPGRTARENEGWSAIDGSY